MKTARLIFLIVIPILFACAPKKPEFPMTAVPAGPLLTALEQRRASFAGLKAVASVEIVKRGRKRAFETVGVVVDHTRRLRIEAYGPLGQSLMAVIWDGRDMLIRMPGDEGMILPGPTGLERLLGKGLEASELCALLSGNIPETGEGENSALLLCGQAGDCVLELRKDDFVRRAHLSLPAADSGREPRVLGYELYRRQKLLFQARFDGFAEISGYRLPMKIEIENPDRKLQLTVLYSEVEVNTPIHDEVFSLTEEAGAIDSK